MTAEELVLYEQHNANIMAVTEKLQNHQNLTNYLTTNPNVAGQLWSTPDIVKRMNEEPNLLAEMDASPESQIQTLFQQHPMPVVEERSSCCTIV